MLRTLVLSALPAILIVAACIPVARTEDGYEAVTFSNDTGQAVSIVYRSPAGDEATIVHRIGAGQVASDDAVAGGGCTIGVLIARDDAGDEIARRTEPLCLGDTWSIVANR